MTTGNHFISPLKALSEAKVLVIGDVMLDRYFYGSVDRISPEAPIPILSLQKEQLSLGGAGNVIANLCDLGATAHLVAVTGQDDKAASVAGLLAEYGIDAGYLVHDESRPTTQKARLIAGHQQLLRADHEVSRPISDELASTLVEKAVQAMADCNIVLLSDYGKGVLTPYVCSHVIQAAKAEGLMVVVDPKGSDYSKYRGADVVTPNRKELAESSGISKLKEDAAIVEAARSLMSRFDFKAMLVTRSEDGMSLVTADSAEHVRTRAQQVYDVSGAGDTVIATFTAALAGGCGMNDAAMISNIAAGIVVAKVGTATVYPEESAAAMEEAEGGQTFFFKDAERAAEQVQRWQRAGLRVGLTNGCFDILHSGHVRYLEQTRQYCDRLIVAMNHDRSVKLLKGDSRPINDEDARACVLQGLRSVDMVVTFGATEAGGDNTASAVISAVKPDIYFKGGDYTLDTLPEAKIVQSYGGDVKIMALYDGYSTTSIIKRSQVA